jgi:hypothetical protein
MLCLNILRNRKRTEPRIEHIQRHLVALLRSCNRNKSFVAVVLRLVDLDDAAAQMPDFIDLRTSFTNDGSYHVVGNEYLLSEWLTRQGAAHRLSWLTMGSRLLRYLTIWAWLMRTSA